MMRPRAGPPAAPAAHAGPCLQGLLRRFLLHQRAAVRGGEQLRRKAVKIAEYERAIDEVQLWLQQLHDLETAASRQRHVLTKGSVHVHLARR